MYAPQIQHALQDAGRRVVRKKRNAASHIKVFLKDNVGKAQAVASRRKQVLEQEILVLTQELKSRRTYIHYLQYQNRKFRSQHLRQQ